LEESPYQGPFFCGVDVGASATKTVLIDHEGTVCAEHVQKSGVDYKLAARNGLENVLEAIPLEKGAPEDRIAGCVATGYGRDNVDYACQRITEITCHGKGCYHLFPHSLTIVDIGGQDSKVIKLDASGRRVDFKMNRKCAAGTGSFLEEIAARLDLPLDKLDGLARGADKKFTLGSFCTVFAKTEILAYIRKGERVENIVRGAFQSVVKRIIEMDRFERDVVLTGGVIHYNPILKDAFEETLGRPVLVPPSPQFTGALGAALMARETYDMLG
jgi:predicted CoA-substrate-specific enzyme activase